MNPRNRISKCTLSDVTDTNAEEVIAAQGANNRVVITTICVTNNHASTDTVVQILNGSTVMWRFNCVHGGGGVIPLPDPLVGEKNTAWSVKAETAASLQCSLSGHKEFFE